MNAMVLRRIGSQLHRAFSGPAVPRIFNSIAFYGGWTALVAYAAAGQPIRGLLVLAAIMVVHFILSHQRLKDVLFLLTVTLAGCLVDVGLLTGGVLTYASPNGWYEWLLPLWMAGVYLLFAAAVDYSLFWLREYPVAAAVLGAMGGISSYIAGAKLGAVQFLLPNGLSLLVIGIVWFVFMPAACWYSAWLDRRIN